MPRGKPKNGFRMTKAAIARGGVPPSPATVYTAMKREPLPVSTETVEETERKLAGRFTAMHTMGEATLKGQNRSLIISGPGGLGKSFTLEKIVKNLTSGKKYKIEMVSGFVRPTGLYRVFYENRFSHCGVVFDDADSIFSDDVSLNLLKKACDSTEKRILSWRAETNMEDDEGEKLPRSFEFNGSVVFLTNQDFDELIGRGHKLAPHLEAMISRSHYLDLAMKTRQDYMVRIKQVVGFGMLRDAGFSKAQEQEVVGFIDKNQERMRELSLRMVLKVAGLMRMNPTGWQELASITCMRNAS